METADNASDTDKVAGALLPESKGFFLHGCPNPSCSHKGDMTRKSRLNGFVLILLLMCGLLPGIIYWLAYRRPEYYCPACGFTK